MMRLDQLLVARGLVSSRQRAKEAILEGQIFVAGQRAVKPSVEVAEGALIEIRGIHLAYPSRAGLKLEKALQVFQIDVNGLTTLDVGASTGGFTSCLLQSGAKVVYAIDVGQNQLVPELKADPRVIVLEKTNIRDVTPQHLPFLVDLATIDVSFISLCKVFPFVRALLAPVGQVVALVKPQFETEGIGLNKHGVIKSQAVHLEYLPSLINQLQRDGLGLLGFDYSPIRGTKGNLEYLAHFKLGAEVFDASKIVSDVVGASWNS